MFAQGGKGENEEENEVWAGELDEEEEIEERKSSNTFFFSQIVSEEDIPSFVLLSEVIFPLNVDI